MKLDKTRHAANVKDDLFAWGVDSQFEAKRCSRVTRAAFAVCPNNPHQALILQLARWWHREVEAAPAKTPGTTSSVVRD